MTSAEQPKKRRFWTFYGVLAFGILVLLFMASLTGSYQGHAAFEATAVTRANQVNIACENYVVEYGALPPTSENYRLVKILCGDNPRGIECLSLKKSQLSANGEVIDPWGTPFRIVFSPASKIQVISAGPDKIFGTPDDITNQ